jgi:hypothetical protein
LGKGKPHRCFSHKFGVSSCVGDLTLLPLYPILAPRNAQKVVLVRFHFPGGRPPAKWYCCRNRLSARVICRRNFESRPHPCVERQVGKPRTFEGIDSTKNQMSLNQKVHSETSCTFVDRCRSPMKSEMNLWVNVGSPGNRSVSQGRFGWKSPRLLEHRWVR